MVVIAGHNALTGTVFNGLQLHLFGKLLPEMVHDSLGQGVFRLALHGQHNLP